MTVQIDAYPGRPSRNTADEANFQLGCVSCKLAVGVQVPPESEADFRSEVEGFVPLTELPAKAAHKSPCGMNAVNGTCRNGEAIAMVVSLIEAGDFEGVTVRV